MEKIILRYLTDQETIELRTKIVNEIFEILTERLNGTNDLSDVGNYIGMAIGRHTCKNGVDKNINAFELSDLIMGIEHGYSLHNGTH